MRRVPVHRLCIDTSSMISIFLLVFKKPTEVLFFLHRHLTSTMRPCCGWCCCFCHHLARIILAQINQSYIYYKKNILYTSRHQHSPTIFFVICSPLIVLFFFCANDLFFVSLHSYVYGIYLFNLLLLWFFHFLHLSPASLKIFSLRYFFLKHVCRISLMLNICALVAPTKLFHFPFFFTN